MKKLIARLRNVNDDGVTLVESVMAMIVFAIVALAAYPLLINGIQAASLNNLMTAATVSTESQIEALRANPTCANLDSMLDTPATYTDSRNIAYTVTADGDECEAGAINSFTFEATRDSDNRVLFRKYVEVLIPPVNGSFDLR